MELNMSDIKIIDNFLDKDAHQKMLDDIGHLHLQYHTPVVYEQSLNLKSNTQKYDWQMVHIFYDHPFGISPQFEFVAPFIEVLQPMILIRVKLNLTTCTETILEHGLHIDINPVEDARIMRSAVYYLNTNNGYTVFESGEKVESVANRLLDFPANLKHSGTTCTDTKTRLALNTVYIESKGP